MTSSHIIVSQPPGQVFPWPKGVQLVAMDDVTFAIPASVLREDEKIGSLVKCDDSVEIALPSVPTTTPGAVIYLKLKAGMSVSLTRGCQAVVVADDKASKPKRIKVVSS